ncbi:MAG: papain-like cysteine protease family protein [Candidatus Nitrosocosmicus sp.]
MSTICTIVKVPGIVPQIKQAKAKGCWATVTTILISWLEQTRYTVDDIVDRLGEEFLRMYKDETGLPASKINDWLYTTGFVMESPQHYSQGKIHQILKDFGPIVFTTSTDKQSLHLTHARVIIGMQNSDGPNNNGECTVSNSDSTEIVGIDPATGSVITLPFSVFCKEIDNKKPDDCELFAQVIHLATQNMFINNLKK